MAGDPTTATIFSAGRGPKIGTVQISASIKETHRRSAEITSHPIERGSDIIDHRRVKQFELSMDGVVSGAPLTGAETAEYEVTGDDTEDRYAELLRMHETSAVFDVATGLDTYSDMMFETLEVTRDAKTGQAIHFAAHLKQVIFADSERTTLPAAKKKKELGSKPTTEADAKKRRAIRQSTLNKLLGGIDGARELRGN